MRNIFFTLFIVLSSLWITGSHAEEPAVDFEYQLGAGDTVRITVYGHDDLSGDFQVDSTGRLSLPLIQDVTAQGSSVKELEQRITEKLQPDYLKNPRVSAEVLNYRPFYIMGEVESPGSYPYVNGMSVRNAVAVAGGFTHRAKKNKIRIVREKDNENKIKAAAETLVRPGDVIEVPQRFF